MRFVQAAAFAAALVLAVAASGAAAQGVGSIITQEVYDSMLPNRDNSLCPASGFYTYDAFIAAADSFPAFGTSGGSDELNKRELAAFFGQTSHETTGGTKGSSDQFQWGYCFKEEINKATSPPYYGRGPIQLTGQSNYQAAGDFLGLDLVGNPDLVSTDAVVSFKTALWFWTTAQGNKPSCHDVILGQWTPSPDDDAAGRVPGYGVITNIINGGIECGVGPNDANVDRIGYYQRYCDMLAVGYGDNLDCYNQRNFGS
ncbi:chitinase 8 [Oryza brachyantha]|uniref:chitinase n=1 Tax=Oryza brachyantha TaxID=4533 RepID=J3N4J4_ORYBR|nr:chitinase 8 [Oryza brachyantha]